MKRTIRSARAALEQATPELNPEMFRRRTAEINQATAKATEAADSTISRTFTNFVTLRDEILVDACELRDGYAALIQEGELGNLSAAELHERFQALEGQKRALVRSEQRLEQETDFVAHIEEDPIAWVDETFYAKYPDITPDFSF